MRLDQERDRDQAQHDEQECAQGCGGEQDGSLHVADQHLPHLDLGQLDLLLDKPNHVFDRHPGQVDQTVFAVGGRSSLHDAPSFLGANSVELKSLY